MQRTLPTTNISENLNGSVERYSQNVKRRRGGQMIQRWVASGLVEAEKHFRRVRGYRDLQHLLGALDALAPTAATRKFKNERDNPSSPCIRGRSRIRFRLLEQGLRCTHRQVLCVHNIADLCCSAAFLPIPMLSSVRHSIEPEERLL